MSAGAGTMMDAIRGQRRNRALLPGKRWFNNKDDYRKFTGIKIVDLPATPPEIMADLRERLAREKRSKRWKSAIAWVISAAIAIPLAWLFISVISKATGTLP